MNPRYKFLQKKTIYNLIRNEVSKYKTKLKNVENYKNTA